MVDKLTYARTASTRSSTAFAAGPNADTFPTRDRANTATAVRRLAAASGFTVQKLDRVEGRPENPRMTWPTYLLGAAYERLVNAWDGLAMFRVLRVGEWRKG